MELGVGFGERQDYVKHIFPSCYFGHLEGKKQYVLRRSVFFFGCAGGQGQILCCYLGFHTPRFYRFVGGFYFERIA